MTLCFDSKEAGRRILCHSRASPFNSPKPFFFFPFYTPFRLPFPAKFIKPRLLAPPGSKYVYVYTDRLKKGKEKYFFAFSWSTRQKCLVLSVLWYSLIGAGAFWGVLYGTSPFFPPSLRPLFCVAPFPHPPFIAPIYASRSLDNRGRRRRRDRGCGVRDTYWKRFIDSLRPSLL